ncbi:lytic transglycosylase domain-containing protein [Cytobacillus gottheilii]|uniref:lytic transglycosylase domain-containing protein n=1 Tax=Cytobacillus gottheilii TaxID=859144 RepID=UPI0008298B59|nr:lytic transglycosylase domain-containing protein [Cytobacillus gottheilii]
MFRYIPFLLLALLLFITSPVSASDYEQQREQIIQQRESLKAEIAANVEKIDNLPEEEKEQAVNAVTKLKREDTRLAAYEKAYTKALGYESEVVYTSASRSLPFPIVDLKLGELVPGEFIPIYQAAAQQYGVDWNVLAAIHKVETDFSRHPTMISSANAVGHMQFMPATFRAYGVDGNNDGMRDPWQLEDAIYSAANYLASSGYKTDVRKAIWHYNHSEEYINKVLGVAAGIRGF